MVGLVWPAQRGNGPVDPRQRSGQGTAALAEAYQQCIRCQKAWLERGETRPDREVGWALRSLVTE
jgi:hypothetical protein